MKYCTFLLESKLTQEIFALRPLPLPVCKSHGLLLQANCPLFDEYGWFGCLLDYFADLQQVEDLERDASEEGDAQRKVLLTLATSPEHELAVIPLVIEKVLLPRLTGLSIHPIYIH